MGALSVRIRVHLRRGPSTSKRLSIYLASSENSGTPVSVLSETGHPSCAAAWTSVRICEFTIKLVVRQFAPLRPTTSEGEPERKTHVGLTRLPRGSEARWADVARRENAAFPRLLLRGRERMRTASLERECGQRTASLASKSAPIATSRCTSASSPFSAAARSAGPACRRAAMRR